jgi:ABC-type transport system substrate-binding protein
MFWYNDILLNKDITPALPTWMRNRDGSPVLVERVDDYTVRWTYKEPNTTFLMELANKDSGDRQFAVFLPSKYLKQFHARYADRAQLDRMAADARFRTWVELLAARAHPPENPDRPTMAAWMPVTRVSDQLFILRRNPYYVGVDKAGNQHRIAMSYAINRNEIKESAFLGLGEPRQPVAAPWHPYYPGDAYAKKYTEYRPDEANRLLDGVGLNRKDAEGFRLFPGTNRRVTVELSVVPVFGPWPDIAQLIARNWERVGIRTIVQVRERALHFQMRASNELQAEIWNQDTSGFPFTGVPKYDPRSLLFGTRRGAQSGQPAGRLPLPPAVPPRRRSLPDRGAGAPGARAGSRGRLPPRGRTDAPGGRLSRGEVIVGARRGPDAERSTRRWCAAGPVRAGRSPGTAGRSRSRV